VDSSAAALSLAERNRSANGLSNIHFREADVFELLSGYAAAGRKFSTIVLDPPAFAKSRGALEGAVRGYKEINLRALKLLEAGGVLVTCSCSHHLSEATFLELLAEASLDAAVRCAFWNDAPKPRTTRFSLPSRNALLEVPHPGSHLEVPTTPAWPPIGTAGTASTYG